MKKTATKGDKKKKKEVAEEITKIEKDLALKHEEELKQLTLKIKESQDAVKVDEICVELEENLVVKNDLRVTKAQKRRDKKSNQEREREKMISEQEKANLQGSRHMETEKIKNLLAARNLTFHDVPSDGNWWAILFIHIYST